MRWTHEDVTTYLRLVRDNLASGVIPEERLQMTTVASRGRCGTVACIGGWMILLRGPKKAWDYRGIELVHELDNILHAYNRERDTRGRLDRLFHEYPDYVSSADAVTAIDRFLGGVEPWTQ